MSGESVGGREGVQGRAARTPGVAEQLGQWRKPWTARLVGPELALLFPLGLPGHSPSAHGDCAQCNSAATHCPSRTPTPQADLWPLSCPVLIRLKKKGDRCAVRSQFVQPICLPEPSSPFPAGHKCQIAGWGHQDESEWSGAAC